ncbi:MAG: antA/AntB antirepressor family protein [Clostridia bacterium]|nr:antA/AntB antirepressor family protein [Clostridia bacterium]
MNARQLHRELENKRRFADWIKQRIEQYGFVENEEFIKHHNFVMVGNLKKPQIDYFVTIHMAKELCMVENNEKGRFIRRYFIETEKRYREIINTNNNSNQLIDLMQNAINYMKENNLRVDNLELGLKEVKNEIENIKSSIDIKIQNNYCLSSDIAEQLGLYSENKIPHSNLIGAIARELGYKISYKHFYEDEHIAIIKDLTKNEYWQVYFKPLAVKKIIKWFNTNKDEIYYEIQYVKNTKYGKRGEIKERGYKIENICYKIHNY